MVLVKDFEGKKKAAQLALWLEYIVTVAGILSLNIYYWALLAPSLKVKGPAGRRYHDYGKSLTGMRRGA